MNKKDALATSFGAALKAHREKDADTPPAPPDEEPTPEVSRPKPPNPKPSGKAERERGKSKDPRFKFVGSYLRRDTHKKVTLKMVSSDDPRDFSELLEDLLQEWLKAK